MTGPQRAGPREPSGPAASGQARSYQGAIEAVFAVLIGAGIGYWVDRRLGSTPWGLLIGLAIGFAAMVLRLLRLGRELGISADPNGSEPGSED